jgi:DNA-binding beta-propeller fold protein YncE
MIVKFTRDGKFVGQIGGRSVSQGNEDTKSVNKPGDLLVLAQTNELYVADGYGNRRVIVFDADTLEFKRMWGAFGRPATDEETGSGGIGALGGSLLGRQPGEETPLDTEGEGSPTFGGPVHGIAVSADGMVYVCDRPNRRVQVFGTDGRYITQLFVNRAGPAEESAGGIALSSDPEQQFLYISDYGNSHIVVVDRKKMEILYQFGRNGAEPGNLRGAHHIAVDTKGNLYTAEVYPGARAQKFNLRELSPTVPANATGASSETISAPYRQP